MLYPKITNVKTNRTITNIILAVTVSISLLLLFLDYMYSPKLNWSIVAIVGMTYVWISVLYALSLNVNLASYTFWEMIELSIILFIIDFVFDFRGWSMTIGIPIVIMATNLTMMIITLIKYKKYIKYAVYEIMILVFSIIYNIIVSALADSLLILNVITLWFSVTNLAFVLALNAKSLKLEIQKKFHI